MLEFLIEDKYIADGDSVVAGVSGGADSMILLWGLIDKQKQVNFSLTVVHVNHHLRGTESDADAVFVKKFCEKRKIECIIEDVDVKKLKVSEKTTLEETARNARYDIFKKIMRQKKCNKLFLAHHKNDQAETILMHIFRGSGISGACGIRDNEQIKRPLLHLTKEEINKIAKEYGIDFVTDRTNNDNDYSRNFIRNVVIPEIIKVYPNAVDAISEFGKKCKEVQKFIEKSIDNSLFDENNEFLLLKNQAFENEMFLVREYIKCAFEKLGIYSDIETKHYKLIYLLAKGDVNKSLDLPHLIIAKKVHAGVKFVKKNKIKKEMIQYEFVLGEIDFAGYGKIKTSLVNAEDVIYGEGSLFVDQVKISTDAVWRTRKIGDMFAKLGTGSKKLNDYFTDKKIGVDERDALPVLAIGDKILVIAENDVSEHAKLDGNTEQIIKIEFLPE